MYNIVFSKPAIKSLQKIPLEYQKKIKAATLKLQQNPFSLDIKKLNQFYKATHRLRIGPYRLFLYIEGKSKEVIIVDIIRRTSTTYN